MTKQNHKLKENKQCIKDALDNSFIRNHEVIKTCNAIEYVKKQGYIVKEPNQLELSKIMATFFISLFLFVAFISFASASINKEVFSLNASDLKETNYTFYPKIALKDVDNNLLSEYIINDNQCGFTS